ncbi:MAG: phosphoglucomutase/phosphomannomutase family protein [Flavobacteriales bacterium]|nr:phosphoglucomutase/phosphomannomutase family protein [Flavobacteriales bacterium]
MRTPIKFGTDGWRAIIADDFTVDNVALVTSATARWVVQSRLPKVAVVGHDCRFGGELFAEAVAKVLLHEGFIVHLAKGPVSTPMVSLGTKELEASIGIIITASHNAPAYNGFKLKGGFGGPLLENDVRAIEARITEWAGVELRSIDLDEYIQRKRLFYTDLETMYVEKVEAAFDLDAIRSSGLEFAFDAMYGSGQDVMRRLFPDITFLHCERNPLFGGIAPEPILRNLGEFAEVLQLADNLDCGLAVDGDADRIALFDSEGNYVDSHHVLLLLIHYLHHYKGMTGKVGAGFSSSVKVKRLCDHYGLELETVRIGFKHLCGIMLRDDVLVGGEESGGIAVKGHIPERDGIWNGMLIWEMMAATGKSLRALIDEVYAITGPFAFERSDLHISEGLKEKVIMKCRTGAFAAFGGYTVQRVEDFDGWKFWLSDQSWVMIRPSGTEPVLRTYSEAATREEALAILEACREEMGA